MELYIKEETTINNEKILVLKCESAWIAEVTMTPTKPDEKIAFEILEWFSESRVIIKELVAWNIFD
jgi:hypothetical protein